ncbi:MAG TPA: DUF1499 domain-containing protein [Nevskiaceae bacterium]|nr:DUF1499 domain-containing protein [Nevskiaceae bacterium]
MFHFSGKRPAHLGVTNGRLSPPPRKPNCVSSQADPADTQHYIAPIGFAGDTATAMKKLRDVIDDQAGAEVIESRPDYLYAEFTSKLMGFVDDVEFYNDGKAIQVRSASRLGYSDLGANRKRVEAIRKAFAG